MKTLKAESTEFGSLKDLKPLLASRGPCLSLYMRLSNAGANQSAKTNALGWREIIRRVEPKIGQYGSDGREMLETVSEWHAVSEDHEPQGKSIAVFRSP